MSFLPRRQLAVRNGCIVIFEKDENLDSVWSGRQY
jgi:hypothetical protein